MNSVFCVRILSKSFSVFISSLQIRYVLSPSELMTLWLWDWNIFHVSDFSNGNASAKGRWVEPGIADTHAQV